MRDYLSIIRRNLISPIVIAIFLLASALVYVGEYRDAWFISFVIIVNSLIGIVQELRAKHALRKLELMSAPKARVVRDGNIREVSYDELRVGEMIELRSGDEVPADMQLENMRDLEVDESMLTGEAMAVEKHPGDMVYAATTVLAGSGQGVAMAVGAETKAGLISATLKRYSPELTPLQRSIRRAITGLTFGAIGLAILIFVVYMFSGENSVSILKTITSAAVTVVPEGLLLASSLLLAFGGLKLASAKVLPQKLSAIEAMALLNLLCVDKTGTLTSDEISFERFDYMVDRPKWAADLVAIVAKEASGGNATGEAIHRALKPSTNYEIIEVMAFSSARKMSAARFRIKNRTETVILGAPEYVQEIVGADLGVSERLRELASDGQRVLLAARLDDQDNPLKKIKKSKGEILGAVVLINPLRHGVEMTVEFLQDSGVKIRVISGDSPETVRFVAQSAEIDNPDAVITGAELSGLSDKAFERAAEDNVIFARVLPEQKERLIAYFKESGRFTGMVGDGVNDALALKKADLGVAMYAGAAATRRVADVILLNNSFTALPMGMKLGNRIMQAIEVIATLFFHKIIYGVILLLATMLIGMTYPFAPRHVTFMNIFLVTMPTIMWTLFPPLPKHRINPKNFWRDTLYPVMPIAMITGLTVAFTYWITSIAYPDRPMHVATMTVMTATFFGVYMVFLVSKMLRVTMDKKAKIARLLYLGGVVLVAASSFGLGFLRDFFDFSLPTVWILWPAVGVIVLAAYIQAKLANKAGKKLLLRNNSKEKPASLNSDDRFGQQV